LREYLKALIFPAKAVVSVGIESDTVEIELLDQEAAAEQGREAVGHV
jgi:hypothetical protein